MIETLQLVLKLMTMSKLELIHARNTTDNQKFRQIIQTVIKSRFPE